MSDPSISPDQRKRALNYFFGTTDHPEADLIATTGLNAETLFTAPLASTEKVDQALGWYSVRTCDLPWRINKIAPTTKANWPFWSGVISGFWATGPLDGKTA